MGWVRSNIPFLAPVTNALGDVYDFAESAVSDVAHSPLVGVGLGLAFPGIGTAIGEAMGFTGAAAAAAGGAVIGGGTAAVGGGDVLQGALLGGAGGALFSGSPGEMTVPTEAPALPSSFDQYLSSSGATVPTEAFGLPTNFDQYLAPTQTSLSDIANTGAISYPVPDQTPFTGTSMLDNAPAPTTFTNPVAPVDYSLGQSDVAGMGGAQGIQSSTLGNIADMGGGQGIVAPTNVGLDAMGGAQGLTTAAAGGGTLGATGVNTGANLAGNLGTSLSAINTGVTQPAATSTGNFMSDTLSNLTPAQIATLGQGVLSGIGGLSTNSAISAGQAAQQAAAEKSLGTLKDIYGTNMAAIAPYQQAGQGALTQINQQMPYLTHQFDANDLNAQLAPNYQFMLGQGQMANQRAANVGGGALSGNTLTGLNRYTQDYAGNAYQNAFNNYNTQRSNIYNTLSGIAGLGTSANAQGIGAGSTYGQNVTNLNTGLAAAQAGANVGQAQNTSNTLSNIGNAATLQLQNQQ